MMKNYRIIHNPRRLQLATALFSAVFVAALLLAACANTAAPDNTFEPESGNDTGYVQVVAVKEPVTIIDRSGAELGSGEVRLYAPQRVNYPEPTTIRLELEAAEPAPGIASTLTAEGTPLADASITESITLHEVMGASLGGVDIGRFTVSATPPTGERAITQDEVNWWEWQIRPASLDAVGANYFQVTIYLPREDAAGNIFDQEVSVLPVRIEVVGPTPTPTMTPTPGAPKILEVGNTFVNWASAITAIAGLISLIFGAYQLIRRRMQKSK